MLGAGATVSPVSEASGDRPWQVPVTVVVPTVGRVALLRACLESIAACEPRPGEVLVVDQSGDPRVGEVVERGGGSRARLLPDDGRGVARALNTGLRAARHDLVLVTNDDCTVRRDWVGAAHEASLLAPGAIVSGQVLPPEPGAPVPSTKADPVPRDFTGEVVVNALYGGNVCLPRVAVLDLGGFDERPGLVPASEDNDLCYRWLRAGRPLRYEPEMVVWHHDWRAPEELVRRYVEYARGNGALYAKYLVAGDRAVLRLAAREWTAGLRSLVGAAVRRRPRWQDPRRGIPAGLPAGLALGVVDELRRRRDARPAAARQPRDPGATEPAQDP